MRFKYKDNSAMVLQFMHEITSVRAMPMTIIYSDKTYK